MVKKNLLLVPQAEDMLKKYKEEIAHEFGIYRSTAEMDYSRSITDTLLKKGKKERKEPEK